MSSFAIGLILAHVVVIALIFDALSNGGRNG